MPAQLLQETFPNGFTLLAEPMPHVQSSAFTFLIPGGVAFEPNDRLGSASMLTDWLTRGAGDRNSRQFLFALDDLGVSHSEGAQNYHISISAATLGKNLLAALKLFADAVRRPLLNPTELEPIRALSIQALQSLEDDPGSKVIHELRRRHFLDPWGRSAIGTLEGVQATTSDDLQAHHQRLSPQGAILGVAGAIDWEQLRSEVKELFEDWNEPKLVEPKETPTGPPRDHITQETQQTQIALAFPSVTVEDPAYYDAIAATSILGGSTSSRLFTEVREKRGLCYSVYSTHQVARDRGAILCYVGTSNERAQEGLEVTLEELQKLKAGGVTVDELEMMRAGLKSSLIMQQESSMSRSSSLATDWYRLGRVRSLEELSAALDGLTADGVSAYGSRLELDQMTLLTLGPNEMK